MVARLDPSRGLIPIGFGLTAVIVGLLAGTDPKMAVVGAFGIAFLLLALADISAGLVGFTLVMFLELAPALGGPALSFTKVAGAVLVISWLAAYATKEDARDVFWTAHPAISGLIAALAAWTAASYFWAEDPHLAISDGLTRLTLDGVLFIIVFEAVRRPRDIRLILSAFVGGATVAAIYGVIAQPNAAEFAYSSTGGAGLGRLAGTVGDPNVLASLLVVGLILAIALALTADRAPISRMLFFGAAALCGSGVYLTGSRGGLVALGGALLAAIALAPRRRAVVAILAIGIALGAVGYYSYLAPQGARDRLSLADGGSGRTDIWTVAWRMVEDKPVLGVGASNFQVSSIHYLLAKPGALEEDSYIVDQPSVTHNAYLHMLTELGVIGVSLFIAILLSCLTCAARAARAFGRAGDLMMEALASAVAVGLVAIFAADIFVSEQYSKELWLLLALGPAMLTMGRKAEAKRATELPETA